MTRSFEILTIYKQISNNWCSKEVSDNQHSVNYRDSYIISKFGLL